MTAIDKAKLSFTPLLRRFPMPYDHAQHRVDELRRDRNVEPRISQRQQHGRRENSAEREQAQKFTVARAKRLVGIAVEEEQG